MTDISWLKSQREEKDTINIKSSLFDFSQRGGGALGVGEWTSNPLFNTGLSLVMSRALFLRLGLLPQLPLHLMMTGGPAGQRRMTPQSPVRFMIYYLHAVTRPSRVTEEVGGMA